MRFVLSLVFGLTLLGCSARPLGASDGSADSGEGEGTSADSDTSITTGVSTGDPGTTGTTTADPTTGDPGTTAPDPRFDFGDPDPGPPIPYDACASNWGPGTWVIGDLAGQPWYANRAWLGMLSPFEPGWLRIVPLGKDAQVEANIEEAAKGDGYPTTGPVLVIETKWGYGDWLQADVVPALFIVDGQTTFVNVRMSVEELLGNWETWDEDDPPRVRGVVAPVDGEPWGFQGQFDAAYCGAFHQTVIGE